MQHVMAIHHTFLMLQCTCAKEGAVAAPLCGLWETGGTPPLCLVPASGLDCSRLSWGTAIAIFPGVLGSEDLCLGLEPGEAEVRERRSWNRSGVRELATGNMP